MFVQRDCLGGFLESKWLVEKVQRAFASFYAAPMESFSY
jgi:hypothetical protein